MFSSLPISKSVSRGASRGKAEKHGDWRERRKRSPCTHRCRGESKPDWGDLRIGVAFAASCRRKSARKHAPSLVGRARRGSTERNHCFSCEIIVLYKGIHRPCGDAPPDRILNRRSFSPALDFTELNGIQKCGIFFQTHIQ